jgi:signal transduction histidine kinase
LESVLALARFALAAVSIFAIILDTTEPEEYYGLVLVLLSLWTAYSLGVIVWLRLRPVGSRGGTTLLVVDLLWPLLITSFTHGASSPLFSLFLFAVIEAAFRWGFPETMLVSSAAAVLLIMQTFVLTGSTRAYKELGAYEFEINALVIRLAYLLVVGFLMGRLGENEKVRRAERVVVNRILLSARVEHGIQASLRGVFSQVMDIYCAQHVVFVAHDVSEDRVFLWHGPSRDSQAPPYVTERGEHVRYLLPEWPQAFYCEKRSNGNIALKSLTDGSLRQSQETAMPDLSFYGGEIRSVLGASADLGREWRFRLLLINPHLGTDALKELRFAESVVGLGAGAVYSVYLVRRLRSRAGAMERARVAREIHDGAIQSLISAEMRVDVVRRRAEQRTPELAPELASIQELLREEVLSLRDLMQQMRPVDLGPQQLVDFLADTVERFRRDSGIEARFLSSVRDDVNLTPHVCRELVRITQEALVNVRKHAHAHTALVTFAHADNGGFRLSVADDGRGFDFSGSVKYTDLLSSPKGPSVIKERVHGIGGELTIESNPGRGSRLDVTLHQRGSNANGN